MSTQIVEHNSDHTVLVARVPAGSFAVSTNWNKGRLKDSVKTNVEKLQGTIAMWGSNNLFPQEVIADIRPNAVIRPLLDWKARAMYSGGMIYGWLNENGKFERKMFPEIQQWLRMNNYQNYMMEAFRDYFRYENLFPQLSKSINGQQIASVHCHDTSQARLGVQNNNGIIDKCYLNANWDNGATVENSIVLPALDPYYDRVGQMKDSKDNAFILPVRLLDEGNVHYALAAWNVIRESEWLKLATLYPKFKNALMENGMNAKYHIKINAAWWEWRFKDWDSLDDEERKTKMQAEVDEFMKVMIGPANAGNFVMTTFQSDPISGKNYDGWIIERIDNGVKQGGDFITDIQEVDFQITRAVGVDASIFNMTSGKGTAGSTGSDKRMAKLNFLTENIGVFDMIMQPYDIAFDYNGWHKKYGGPNQQVIFKSEALFGGTLDQGAAPLSLAS